MARRQLRRIGGSQTESLDEGVEDAGVVAFDFDGTLTTHDSYTAFLKWRGGPAALKMGMTRRNTTPK